MRPDKYRQYLIDIGRPSLMAPQDREQVNTHVLGLKARGMSAVQIAAQANMSVDNVNALARHKPGGRIRRSTYEAVLAVRLEPTAGKGPHVVSLGPRRRMQALARAGFTTDVLAETCGVKRAYFNEFVNANRGAGFMFASTATRFVVAYDKLAHTSPADHGICERSVRIAQGYAARKGWAPPGCWDPETIDDPTSFPEWTGSCGTPSGYRIHLRENIPKCRPCTRAWLDDRYTRERK